MVPAGRRRTPTGPRLPRPFGRLWVRSCSVRVPSGGRQRVVVESVRPCIDCGRFPAKRSLGDRVTVVADIFADGHEQVAAVLRHRHETARRWREVPMRPLGNDRWDAAFEAEQLGLHRFSVRAWIDRFATWAGEA